jgi:serine/threonine protein kinase
MTFDQRLVDLLLRYEELQSGGESITPEELCQDSPELLEEVRQWIGNLQVLDQRLNSTVPPPEMAGSTPRGSTDPGAGLSGPLAMVPGPLRYNPVKFHDRGGLGDVYLAQDQELLRQVALKRMRPLALQDPPSRQRFLLEAVITARLEHPGIVPVYGLTQDDKGQACYAMRFIQGENLRKVIDAFHEKAQKQSPGERSLQLRQLISRLVTVCNTVAYAHSCGILHRDLKPGNIMLAKYGETMVVDWGLAKPLTQPALEEGAEGEGSPPGQKADSSTGKESNTEMGRPMGTLVYASPEQASGQWNAVGPASDIYSLGATLYVLLTGQPPFGGRTREEVLERIKRGTLVRPRQLVRAVPPPLEAICLKAMAVRPEDRYASALDLVADLERWLADEPVSVYRESLPERLARWMRRHRTWVQAGAATLLLVSMVSVTAAFLINAARQKEHEARAQEAQARQEAEASRNAEAAAKQEATRRLKEALRATDRWSIGVSLILEDYYPDMDSVRQDLLEEAARDYARWAQEKHDDPQLRISSARAYIRLGNVQLKLKRDGEAEKTFRQAEAAFVKMADEDRDNPLYRLGLADSRTRLGIVQVNLGETDKAADSFAAALKDLDALAQGHPQNQEYQDARGVNLVNFGELQIRIGKLPDAEKTLNRAIDAYQSLARNHQREARYRIGRAAAREMLAKLFIHLGRLREATALLDEEVASLTQLVKQYPRRWDYRAERGNLYTLLAFAYRRAGQEEQEIKTQQRALADYDAMKVSPGVALFREDNLAVARLNLCQLLHTLGRNHEAREQLTPAARHLRQVKDAYEGPRYREYWAATSQLEGQVLSDLGQLKEAIQAQHNALDEYSQLASEAPKVPGYVERRALSQAHLARVLHQNGEDARAKQEFDQSIEALKALAKKGTVPSAPVSLAWSLTWRGDLLWDQGDQKSAVEDYRQALQQHQQAATTAPPTPEQLQAWAWLLLTCPAPELRNLSQARQLVDVLEQQGKTAETWLLHGVMQYRAGKWDNSKAALEICLDLRPHGDGRAWFYLAMACWQLADREKAREHYQAALTWVHKNRPGNLDLKRLRAEVDTLLAKEPSG